MCHNQVIQYVPRGFGSYKEVEMTCGNTSIYGTSLLCEECETKIDAGKMGHPDYCRHGVRYTEFDIDCFRCEMGED